MASVSFEEARKLQESFMAGAVRLVFPAFDDLPPKTFWFGTRRFDVDGEEFVDALPEIPNVVTNRGLAQDKGSFVVNDIRSDWYQALKPYEDVLEDCDVVIKECLKTSGGLFESEITLNGYLEQMTLGDKNQAINFTAVADTSRQGRLMGSRILTLRYCSALFNKNGLRNSLYDACGWQASQGGNPVFCTHKRKGASGCEDHMNDARFFAVEALQSAEVTTTSGGSFEYDGGGGNPCFTPETLIWMADGSYKPIYQVKKDDWVWSSKLDGTVVARKILEVFKHTVNAHLVYDFGQGRKLNPTPEHMMAVTPSKFRAADQFDSGDALPSYANKKWNDFVIRNTWLEEKYTRVHNFHVEETETYFVVVGGVKILVHNNKRGDIL